MNPILESLGEHERRSLYARLSKCPFNMEAVFSDETENFVSPLGPSPGEEVEIRLRTGRGDAECVFLNIRSEGKKNETAFEMSVAESREKFDYYAVKISAPDETARYYFSVRSSSSPSH